MTIREYISEFEPLLDKQFGKIIIRHAAFRDLPFGIGPRAGEVAMLAEKKLRDADKAVTVKESRVGFTVSWCPVRRSEGRLRLAADGPQTGKTFNEVDGELREVR